MIRRLWPLLLIAGLTACQTDAAEEVEGFSADTEDGEAFEAFSPNGKADGLGFGNDPLKFGAACAEGDRLTIAAVGDVLIHGRLQKQAFAQQNGFESLWEGISDLMQAADITYANLEGPTAAGTNKSGRDVADPGKVFDDSVYSSYPMFNYHPSLITDMMRSGVDVVSTANNHSLDRRSLGADRTIEALEVAGLAYTGTRKKGDNSTPWFTITKQNGFSLAWLACTYGTNGIPDNHDQVLNCFSDTAQILEIVKGLAQNPEIDAVIVTPHWGQEYKANPSTKQVDLSHDLLDAGATLVIGSHPHVLQPWERHVTPDGRETFAIYSLGNFISGQRHLPRRSTLLLYIGLVRTETGVQVSGARYVPLHMTTRPDGFLTLEAIDRVGAHGDSRALTTAMYGQFNLHPADTPVQVNPECDPDWIPPHPHDGWIGGACTTDTACGGTFCDLQQPGGFCTQSCDRFCPDLTGRAATFCVADPTSDISGMCVLTCAEDSECRPGYACQQAERFKQPEAVKPVCTQVASTPEDGAPEDGTMP